VAARLKCCTKSLAVCLNPPVSQDSNGTLELAEWLQFSRRLAMRGEAAAKRMILRLQEIVKKEIELAQTEGDPEVRPMAKAAAVVAAEAEAEADADKAAAAAATDADAATT
jgi:hypothetical protein